MATEHAQREAFYAYMRAFHGQPCTCGARRYAGWEPREGCTHTWKLAGPPAYSSLGR